MEYFLEDNYYIAIMIAAKVFVLIFGIPLHNVLQVYVAKAFGNKEAIARGFDSLNPLVHVDFRAILAFFLFGICWTRSVPKNFTTNDTKYPRLAKTVTVLSGTFSYLLLSVLLMLVTIFIFPDIRTDRFFFSSLPATAFNLYDFLDQSSQFLLVIFLVQFIPIYPFDLGELIGYLVPGKVYYKIVMFINRNEAVISILFLIFFAPIIGALIVALSSTLHFRLLSWLLGFPNQ